ncbi:MAG: tyrosine-type recombinase/integrase, partial [Candidatus Anammoxibacter sp.]
DEEGRWQSLSYPDVRTESDAGKRLAVLIAERERGNLGLVIKGRKKKHKPTIADFGKEYLSLCDKSKYNTYHAKKKAVKILTQFLGNYKLSELTTFHVRRFRIDRQRQDNVKPATINLDIAILRNLLNLAIEKGIIEKNPCAKLKTLTVSQTGDRLLSDTEMQLVFDALTSKDRLMVLLGMLGGLRLNETLKLTWDDFDFQNNLLIFVQSKTGKKVEIPLSCLLIDELQGFRGQTEGIRLFEKREIGNSVPVSYSSHFGSLFKKMGICNFTYHNLRHQCASMHSEAGTSIAVTQNLLQHAM